MARFYKNENIPAQVVTELRRLGHDVLAFAAAERRILLTHNRHHFLRLHQNRTADHAGIVLCTFAPIFAGRRNALMLPLQPASKFSRSWKPASAADAARLEDQIRSNPEGVRARIRLLNC